MITKAKLSSSKKKQTKKTTTSSRKKLSVGGKLGPIAERMDAKEWAKLFDVEIKNKKTPQLLLCHCCYYYIIFYLLTDYELSDTSTSIRN